MVAPLLIPGILDLPVSCAVFSSKSHQLNSMTTKRGPRHMVVHATFVCWEIRIHRESDVERTVLNEVCHDPVNPAHRVGRSGPHFVIGITDRVTSLALVRALW